MIFNLIDWAEQSFSITIITITTIRTNLQKPFMVLEIEPLEIDHANKKRQYAAG